MPNWAYSKVTLMGSKEVITEIKDKLSKPYLDPWSGLPNPITNKPRPAKEITGLFLLWNIVRPTNLRAYLEIDEQEFQEIIKENNLEEIIPNDLRSESLKDRMDKFQESLQDGSWFAEIQHQLATGEGWYEWNCRNWGTKWEIRTAKIEYEMATLLTQSSIDDEPEIDLEITYRLETAWSPPVEALQALHQQYPEIAIKLSSIDESDCWAMSAEWSDQFCNETDEEITHDFGMDLRGYCNLECCNDYE